MLRILNRDDVVPYRALRLDSFRTDPLAFSESYEDEVKRSEADFIGDLETYGTPPERFVLGAFNENNELTGFARFRRDTRTKARHKAFIYGMYIRQDYRYGGIGRMLMNELIKRAGALSGLEQIHLWVLHSGSSASGFYQKCGFVSQGTLVRNDLKIGDIYVDAGYMVLYL